MTEDEKDKLIDKIALDSFSYGVDKAARALNEEIALNSFSYGGNKVKFELIYSHMRFKAELTYSHLTDQTQNNEVVTDCD